MKGDEDWMHLAVSHLGWNAEMTMRASAAQMRAAANALGIPVPPDLPEPEPIWPGALEIALTSAVLTLLGICTIVSWSLQQSTALS